MGYSPWGRKELDSTEVTAGMQRPHFVGRPDPHLTRKETKFTCERQPSPYSYECGVFANRSLKRQLGAAGGPVVGAPRFHGRGRKFDLLIGELESHTSWGMGKIDVRIKKYPEHLLEGLMLKLQYSGRLMRRAISLEKTLMLGKTEGRRRRRKQWMRWLNGVIDSKDMSLHKLSETVKDREAWPAVVLVSQRAVRD